MSDGAHFIDERVANRLVWRVVAMMSVVAGISFAAGYIVAKLT